jgi:hypothetical protein
MRRSICVVLLVIAMTPLGWTTTKASGITMRARTSQDTYVEREPLKIEVYFKNESNEVLRMIPVQWLGQNMEFMFLEVEGPDGTVARRKFTYCIIHEALNPNWAGEPLAPRETAMIVLYPNVTRQIWPDKKKWSSFTIGKPGTYKMKIAYEVPALYKNIWRPENGILYSNELTLKVTKPTIVEKEILDAYWDGGTTPHEMRLGDDNVYIDVDEDLIDGVVRRYPDNRLTKYLLFNKARYKIGKSRVDAAAAGEAEVLYETIRRRYPEFRVREVCSGLSLAYAENGKLDKAREAIKTAVKDNPALTTEYVFMSRVIYVETGTSTLISEWERSRAKGDKWNVPGVDMKELRAIAEEAIEDDR